MLKTILQLELEQRAGQSCDEKHAGRTEQALAILDECDAIIKRIKAMDVPKQATVCDTCGQLKGDN